MGDFIKWAAVAVVVWLAWRWLGGGFNAAGQLSAYSSEVGPYGGNPGGVWMSPGMVQSPWFATRVHSRPARWSGDGGVWIGNGGAQFGMGGADINFSF